VPAELSWCPEVDLPTQDAAQLELHRGELQEARASARLELDEHVHVAVGPEPVSQHRSEQGQPTNAMLLAESRHRILQHVDPRHRLES